MPDRRSVDDLSIEELEQILRIKKQEARAARLERLERVGRRRGDAPLGQIVDSDDDEAFSIPYESYLAEAEARPPGRARDRLLLGIELLAALGLVAVLIFAVNSLRAINRESAAAQAAEVAALPTPSPTPLISLVVLPSGHTPPTSPDGARPNYDEVPARLRPLVEQQFAGPVTVPTAAPDHALRMRIPAIDVDAPVVQGDGWEQLKKGIGQHVGTANPGQPGNMVVSAHNDIYGEIFRYLDQLAIGDEILVQTQTGQHVYRVADTRIVDPTTISVMDQTAEPIITLISCYPYLVNNQRIVVIGELVQ